MAATAVSMEYEHERVSGRKRERERNGNAADFNNIESKFAVFPRINAFGFAELVPSVT